MQTAKLAALLLAALALVPAAPARIGESASDCNLRYGGNKLDPGTQASIKSSPLIPGAKERRYDYRGWTLRIAFADDRAIALEFTKGPEATKKTGDPNVTDVETAALLAVNGGNPAGPPPVPWEKFDAKAHLFVQPPPPTPSSVLPAAKNANGQPKFAFSAPAPTVAPLTGDLKTDVEKFPYTEKWLTRTGLIAGRQGGRFLVQDTTAIRALAAQQSEKTIPAKPPEF